MGLERGSWEGFQVEKALLEQGKPGLLKEGTSKEKYASDKVVCAGI